MSSVPRRSDPVIEAYKKGVDRTLLRENLTLTVEERLQKLAAMLTFLSEWRGAARKPKADFPALLTRTSPTTP